MFRQNGLIITLAVLGIVVMAGCVGRAVTHVTPLSQDRVQVTATVAPACGDHGAQKVALQQAAIVTIRMGYYSFEVIGSSAKVNPLGMSFVGNTAIAMNQYAHTFEIKMFQDNDPAGSKAMNARGILGKDWSAIVAKGEQTSC